MGANIEAMTSNSEVLSFSNRTPLHEAAVEGKYKCVEYLISIGANITALTEDSETPFDLAKKYNHNNIFPLFKMK
ncbi:MULTISPECIES: ankyrin repeat domain-containing protein [unclassified Brenneria]|uniref:ankyrin repeat domain-containing protein n=1 Tax=unclassified Brenneria TaxID=2634434 RepID=UPI0018F0D956|nr:ankyrin repeat domain-containing protein [Brenneria sp. L3-3C-1]MBJ7221433.1 ankyrin repeat domain-containing protein [Brenneria sp. L3-3C-1]MEE3642676.1 ankyrin repeat domain-containing protein [Brenneria sp. L3_3C_1]